MNEIFNTAWPLLVVALSAGAFGYAGGLLLIGQSSVHMFGGAVSAGLSLAWLTRTEVPFSLGMHALVMVATVLAGHLLARQIHRRCVRFKATA